MLGHLKACYLGGTAPGPDLNPARVARKAAGKRPALAGAAHNIHGGLLKLAANAI